MVRAKVASGHNASASEVVREALRLMARQEQLMASSQQDETDRQMVKKALIRLRKLSKRQTLGLDLSVRNLIDEGRR